MYHPFILFGSDLHDYEPTQKDMLKVNKSDLFVYTGDDLDPVAKKLNNN